MEGKKRRNVRILVVEDERKMAAVLRKALEEERHSVLVAHTGKDGLELALTYSFDAVVLDIM